VYENNLFLLGLFKMNLHFSCSIKFSMNGTSNFGAGVNFFKLYPSLKGNKMID